MKKLTIAALILLTCSSFAVFARTNGELTDNAEKPAKKLVDESVAIKFLPASEIIDSANKGNRRKIAEQKYDRFNFSVIPQHFSEDREAVPGRGASKEKSNQSSTYSRATSSALLLDDYIRLNKGWKKVVLGASEQEIKTVLGEPSFTYLDILDAPKNIWRYDEPGLIVWFKKEKGSKAVKILFFAGAKPDQTDNTESFMVSGSASTIRLKKVPFAPEKAAWWASVEQVIAAYGKPDSQNKFDLFGSSVTLLKYGETNFYFRRGELYQIALISQDY